MRYRKEMSCGALALLMTVAPVLGGEKAAEKPKQEKMRELQPCVKHLKERALDLVMFEAEHDGDLGLSPDNWAEKLQTFINSNVFKADPDFVKRGCPLSGRQYLWLMGKLAKFADVSHPSITVTFADSVGHGGVFCMAFLDGHVQFYHGDSLRQIIERENLKVLDPTALEETKKP